MFGSTHESIPHAWNMLESPDISGQFHQFHHFQPPTAPHRAFSFPWNPSTVLTSRHHFLDHRDGPISSLMGVSQGNTKALDILTYGENYHTSKLSIKHETWCFWGSNGCSGSRSFWKQETMGFPMGFPPQWVGSTSENIQYSTKFSIGDIYDYLWIFDLRGKALYSWSNLLSNHTIIIGWFQPLWKILVNWDDYSQYMEK